VQPEKIVIYPMIPHQKEFQLAFISFAATAPILHAATPMFEPTQAHRSVELLPRWATALEAHHALNVTFMSALIMLTKVSATVRIVAYHMSTVLDNCARLRLEVLPRRLKMRLLMYQAMKSLTIWIVTTLTLTEWRRCSFPRHTCTNMSFPNKWILFSFDCLSSVEDLEQEMTGLAQA